MIKNDAWIKQQDGMITPFEDRLVRWVPTNSSISGPIKAISHGLSSYGYDIVIDEGGLRVFSPIGCAEIDPKRFDDRALIDAPLLPRQDTQQVSGWVYGERWWVLPAHSYALATTREYFRMPSNVLGVVLGKSTYARSGLLVNATPLEPGWEGNLVLEISNTASVPIRVYANEGIAQVIFFEGEPCEVTYADRDGKYQGQTGIQTAKV